MNDQKIGYQARILPPQPSHGLIIPADFSSEFSTRRSPLLSGPHNQGLYLQHNHASMDESQSNHSLSSTIISRFGSPTSAFFAAERCMGFPHYDSFGNLSSDPSFDFTNSSQPLPNPNDNAPSMFQHDLQTQFSINSKHNQDIRGYCGSFGSTFSQLSFGSCDDHHNQGKQSSRVSTVNCGSISGNNSNNSSASAGTSKTRIRWNQDLHEKFVECVNRLGGAEKATPKAILKLMDSEGLTIFHVKSHLQKYRIAKYLPDSSEGKSEKRACLDVTTQLEATAGWQIKEALQLQLDVQRRLHEQLEIQRKLQLQIEEQGKQLKKMFDMQQKTSNSLFNTQSSDISSLDEDPLNSIDETQVFPSKIS